MPRTLSRRDVSLRLHVTYCCLVTFLPGLLTDAMPRPLLFNRCSDVYARLRYIEDGARHLWPYTGKVVPVALAVLTIVGLLGMN